MPKLTPVDSRWYVVAYELHSRREIPPDFGEDAAAPEFHAAVFLPRDDPDRRGRSAYPPRILALSDNALAIIPHPLSAEPIEHLDFDRITSVESGHILLSGWLRFLGPGLDLTLPYNTRGWRAVDRFLRKFRTEYLAGPQREPGARTSFGPPLDLKFGNALADEVDAEESVEATLFRPSRRLTRGRLLWRRRSWAPADLLILTSRRLLWLTDREGGACARYGSIARYAPLSNVRQISREQDQSERFLRVLFRTAGLEWRILLSEEQWQDANWFEGVPGQLDRLPAVPDLRESPHSPHRSIP